MITSNGSVVPYYDAVYEEMTDVLYGTKPKNPLYDETVKEVSIILFQLGIRSSLLGYKYLRSAVKMALEDPSSVNLITKIMYPKIAREYFTTTSRVERSIRTAISSIDIDNPLKRTMFICSSREYPTNKEFIAGVAEYINRK